MATIKLTLNELKNMVKKIITEDLNNEITNIISGSLSDYFVDYYVNDTFKKEETDSVDGINYYSFSLLIPKGSPVIEGLTDANEVETFLEESFGTSRHTGAGESFSRTSYNVTDRGDSLLVMITFKTGFDI